MQYAKIKAIVRRSANTDRHDYLKHDAMEFEIKWDVEAAQRPSPNYPIMIKRSPNYGAQGDYWPTVFIYRYPGGEDYLGTATAQRDTI